MDFFQVVTVEEARKIILDRLSGLVLKTEKIDIRQGLHRVLAEDVFSSVDVPAFSRSTADGYAVRAKDTFGASEGLPAYLTLKGEILMGQAVQASIGPGEAFKISTGGMLPGGADAVVMVEYTEILDDQTLEVRRPVVPGEEVILAGEDIRAGELLLRRGHLLRPQDLGALAGIGRTQVEVYQPIEVAVISTGDEIVEPETKPLPGQIRDINSLSITASIKSDGAIPHFLGIVKDSFSDLHARMSEALEADMIILSGGSSIGTRDVAAGVINALGEPGVLVHGVSLSPGKPTILGMVGEKPVVGLPGHPVSAMVAYDVLVRPLIRFMSGLSPEPQWRGIVQAILTRSIASAPGREEYVRVVLRRDGRQIVADPVLGKSGLITTMVRADGVLRIPLSKQGYEAGEQVEVFLL